jgi:hypothetical protein
MRLFLWGVLTTGCATIALQFLRYWKNTSDPLFGWFGLAFGVMSLNWLGLALIDPNSEVRHTLYLLRLAAFLLIIAGILQKNRRGGHA